MGAYKYKAFISYSHKDDRWGKWLHRRLENHPLPKKIVGVVTATGPIPKRLTPIFRDREELAAADNLGDKIEQALSQSENLIIICSPQAARSHWVNQEILYFKRHNRGAQIFSVIVEGEPFASNIPGRKSEECFPPALRYQLDKRGELSDKPAEPLAADFRDHADGKRLGVLKLVSGMVGLGLDEIVQRDMKRSRTRVTAITAGGLITMLAMGTLTSFALGARADAEQRRNDAEGLIDFMLTDLRDKLEPVGRLDILGDVASEALQYYDGKENLNLSCKSVSGRARAHYLNTRILADKKEWEGATKEANRALEIMSERAQRCMDDPHFIISYAHAYQWSVEAAWSVINSVEKQELTSKHRELAGDVLLGYENSKTTIEHLTKHSNRSFEYAMELGSANMLIGRLLIKLGKLDDAKHAISTALKNIQDFSPDNENGRFRTLIKSDKILVLRKYAHVLSWQATTHEAEGDLPRALELYDKSHEIYTRLVTFDNDGGVDWINRFNVITANYEKARILSNMGNHSQAQNIIISSSDKIEPLLAHDPQNRIWIDFSDRLKTTHDGLANLINEQKETP